MNGKRYLTVTALTRYMKAKLENDVHLQSVLLKGEISNFKYHSRGHMYFTLKDENARISAVMFAGNNRTIRFNPEDGMTVLVQGDISLYETAGNYQLYVKEMQPDGIGHLHLAYEQLKKKLEEEGLFSELYKIQLPKYPQCIGVITSPTGAAVRDILTTINRRYPLAKVIVFPTLVQGEQAAPSIVQSIKKANDLGYVDVIIAGRGGGSIEELWAFNEEMVARAIHESIVPIISAVGHETDFTIADFVADLRAPTPTAAAEMAVPSKMELIEKIERQSFRLQQSINQNIQDKKHRLASLQQSYAFRYPQQLRAQKEQELDRLLDRLHKGMADLYKHKSNSYQQHVLHLQRHHPHQKIERARVTFGHMEKDLQHALHKIIREKQHVFSTVISQLETLSPLSIMNRGYSLAYNDKKQLVKSVEDTQVGDVLTIQVQDGSVACKVSSIEERGVSNE